MVGTYTNDHVPGRPEDPVDGEPGKGGKEAVLWAQLCQEGIRHGLRDDDEPDGETYTRQTTITPI